MFNNFSNQNNQFQSNIKDNLNPFIPVKVIKEEKSNIANPFQSKIFPPQSNNTFQNTIPIETSAQNKLFNVNNNNIENMNFNSSENNQIIITEKEIPGNTKIFEKTKYITYGGENLTDEDMKEIKKISENSSTKTTTKTITTSTIIKDGQKTTTKTTEKVTKIGGNGDNITTEYNKEVNTLPILSDKIMFKETIENNNESNNFKSNQKLFGNILNDNEDINDNKSNNFDNLFKSNYNAQYMNEKQNINNIESSNRIDEEDNLQIEKNNNIVTFRAPDNNHNYLPLSSNISFGVKNNNLNMNKNNSNKSSSVDKSSEQEYIIIGKNEENDKINLPLSGKLNVKFGYTENKENKNDIYSSPQKNNLNLVDDAIKFGFEENKKVEEPNIIKNEIIEKDEMDIEPGEIKDNKEIPENENLNKINEEKKEKNEEKEEKKEEKVEKKKEIIFNKKLFDYDEPEQGKETLFTQKLFQNSNETNNNKEISSGKSLFDGIFKTNENSFSTNFGNKKTEDLFFKNNQVNKKEIKTENEEIEIKPTLNEIIKEGGVYNNDSQKKEKNTLNPFSNSLNNINPFSSNNNEQEKDKDKDNQIENNEINNKNKNDLSSPLTAYINENKGKNFILGDNKEENKNNLFKISNNGSLYSSPFINSSYNPFSSILSSNQNNKKENNNVGVEEKKQDKKNELLINTDSNENKIKNENKSPFNSINNNEMISKPNISTNSNQQSYNIFDSQGNLEKYGNFLNKDIANNLASNNNIFWNNKNGMEIKTTSSLFPNLNLERSKTEIYKHSNQASSLFPGLDLKKEEIVKKKESKPLFPGAEPSNSNKSSIGIFNNENEQMPLFPGGFDLKKSKSNLFGNSSQNKGSSLFNNNNETLENKNESLEKKEDIKEEKKLAESYNSFTLFNTKDEKKDELDSGINNDKEKENFSITEEEKIQLENNISSLTEEQKRELIKILNENQKNTLLNTSQIEIKGLPDRKIKEIEKYVNEFLESNNKLETKKEPQQKNLITVNDMISYNNIGDENKKNIENDEESGENEEKEENEDLDIEIDIKNNSNNDQKKEKKEASEKIENENKENIPETKNIPINKENDNTNNASDFNVDIFQKLSLDKSKSGNALKPVKKSLFGDLFNKNSEQDFGSFFSKNSGGLFNDNKKGLFDTNKNSLFENSQGGGLFDKKQEDLFQIKSSGKLFENPKDKNDNDNRGLSINNYDESNFRLFEDKNNMNSEKEKKDKDENTNLFGNNDGKSLFSEMSDNDTKNLKFFNTETTPIKVNSFFKNEKEKEKKEKMEIEKKEEEELKQEKGEREKEEEMEEERINREKEEEMEEERINREKEEEMEEERINREKEENEKLYLEREKEMQIKIVTEKETQEIEDNKEKENDEENEKEENIDLIGNGNKEIEIGLINEKREQIYNNNNENQNEESEPIEMLEEEEEELSEEEEEYNGELSLNNKSSVEKDYKTNIIQRVYSERKPLTREMYSNLIKKMKIITNNRKNKINEQEKNIITIYCNNLNEYLKELEDKINLMEKGYIETLVKKHFEKDKNKKLEIIIKANISKKRNDVKKIFTKLMRYIKNNLEPANQKYYYILILKILDKYEIINEEEINKTIKLFKPKKHNKLNLNKSNDYNSEFDNNEWINQNYSKKGWGFKIFAFVLPIAYFINYIYANIKA